MRSAHNYRPHPHSPQPVRPEREARPRRSVLAFAVVQRALERAKEPHQGLEIKVHCSMLVPDAMAVERAAGGGESISASAVVVSAAARAGAGGGFVGCAGCMGGACAAARAAGGTANGGGDGGDASAATGWSGRIAMVRTFFGSLAITPLPGAGCGTVCDNTTVVGLSTGCSSRETSFSLWPRSFTRSVMSLLSCVSLPAAAGLTSAPHRL